MPLTSVTIISPPNRGIRTALALISTQQTHSTQLHVSLVSDPLLFFVATSSCSFYHVISPFAPLFFCFSYKYSYIFSFTSRIFISFIRLSSISHASLALLFSSFYFYLSCLPPHSFISSSLYLSSAYASFTPFIVLKLPPVSTYSYTSSYLLLSPSTKPSPAPSSSHCSVDKTYLCVKD